MSEYNSPGVHWTCRHCGATNSHRNDCASCGLVLFPLVQTTAVERCEVCGGIVDERADACPHCG